MRIVNVLEYDPDLGAGLEGQRREQAASRVRAATVEVPGGAWHLPAWPENVRLGLGLLVLEGALLRRVGVDGRVGGELLARGDLLRPWQHEDAIASVSRSSAMRVLAPTRLAVLDLAFAQRIAAYPEIQGQLVARALRRSRSLAITVAIVHQPTVHRRLVMLLWHLADRFGVMRGDGVLVPVKLTHAVFAELVAARRPTVSAALRALQRDATIAEHAEGWVLRGAPPSELSGLPGEMALTATDGAASVKASEPR